MCIIVSEHTDRTCKGTDKEWNKEEMQEIVRERKSEEKHWYEEMLKYRFHLDFVYYSLKHIS